ncbi:hypothetical protein NQD34_003269 [Periophthalmus magnuspinnatus]|uniref:Corticotropin-releasing factor domain-containing protein n=1 Tax=Periophthalmus magnuspinnatus TaxID=409849 RepID=A0A3B4APF3_9GOBI|nr:hypothetical protein NQD34_003269 [Periophthalmus magnuspinnatus]
MSSVAVCFCFVLLLSGRVQSQRGADQAAQGDLMAVNVLTLSGALNSLLQAEQRSGLREPRAPRLPLQIPPKRAQQGSRFALSLDVPTSILSVLIDLAKNQDMRTKAAANAQLMARIGRRR